MAKVTASLQVRFDGDSEAGGVLTAEIDAFETVEGGLNSGKVSFVPGDQPVYLVTKSSNVTLLRHITSLIGGGGFLFVGQRNILVEETVQFIDSDTVSLSKPSLAVPSVNWFGTDLGVVSQNSIRTNLVAATPGVAVASVSYQSVVDQYRLVGVPSTLGGETDFQVLIFIEGFSA